MEPFMPQLECSLFYKYLNNCFYFFEFGCGGSTYQASLRNNIVKIVSVDTNINWIEQVKFYNLQNKVEFIYVYMDAENTQWGWPGHKSNKQDWIKYAKSFNNLDEDIKKQIDTILIDGRFRVATALNIWRDISKDTKVLFDDFLDRSNYHVVLNYYEIVDQAGRMVVLQKKEVEPPNNHIIDIYELDPS